MLPRTRTYIHTSFVAHHYNHTDAMTMNLPPVTVASPPLLPARDDHHERSKAFSLIEMVPDLNNITIDEEDIDEEIDEMISRCIIPSCHK